MSPSEEKIRAVIGFPEPQNVKQLQGFLGQTGFFRKYIKGYAKIAIPLTNLLKKVEVFYFGAAEKLAFEELKKLLADKPILSIYNPDTKTELHTDAFKDGYAAILMQEQEGNGLLPVYYYSKKTTEAEMKYDSYQLEALAVIRAVEKFRSYLLGIHFKIVTDCQAFEKTLKKKDVPVKVARWAMMLE